MDRRLEKSKGSPVYIIGDSGFHATLKGSYVYRKNQCLGYSTPSGSHLSPNLFFYKHPIPLGLRHTKSTRNGYNADNNVFGGFDSTPSGSHPWPNLFFYKHPIPSGLFRVSIEANIQKGLAELKELM